MLQNGKYVMEWDDRTKNVTECTGRTADML